MTEPEAGSPPLTTGLARNQLPQRWPQCSEQDAIRRADFINRAALEAVRGLLETPVASSGCSGVPGWPGQLGVACADEHHSLELVHRCLVQQSAALADPALSGLGDSVQALERTVFTLREVARKKRMLAGLTRSSEGQTGVSGGSREPSIPIGTLSDGVRRKALALVGKLTDQQAMLNRAIETRAALVQQVFLG
jgi:hypothetical protein